MATTGQQSDAALVLTTLVLATTFTPIKQRLESIVTRRYEVPHRGIHPSVAVAGSAMTESDLRAFIADVVRQELADKPPEGKRPTS